jgi:hypothetical protein
LSARPCIAARARAAARGGRARARRAAALRMRAPSGEALAALRSMR